MRLKLFSRFFLYITLIIFFCLTSMMVILSLVYNNYMINLKYDLMERTGSSVANFVTKLNLTPNLASQDKGTFYIINNLSDVADLDVYVTDMNGVIKVCSCDEWGIEGFCEHSGNIIPQHIFEQKNNDLPRKAGRMGMYETAHYIYAQEISIDGEVAGYVVSAAPMTAMKSLTRTTIKLYVFSAVIPVILMFVALYIISYRVTKPLKLMSVAAKSMAKGDFSKRIPVTTDDEIGELAVSFNQMTNSLARLEDMRKGFVANISHEFRTPLTTIGGFIDGIVDGTIEQEKQNYYLEIVSEEVKRLSRMVQSMLNIAKLESGEFVLKPENFDVRDLVLNVVIAQEQRIELKKLNITGLDTLPSIIIKADKDLIHRVIYNLVDNAVKFTNESGKIDFAISFDSKQMKFKIWNSGNGIPQKDLPYVFERFFKTDKSRSDNKNSTGLGLYMVKTIVKNHGGSVNVSSVEDSFTAFEVTLPIR